MKKLSLKNVVTGIAVTTLVAGLASGAYAGGKSSCAKSSCGKGSCGSKGAKKGFFQDMYDWMKGGSSCGKSSAKSSCGKGSCGK